MPRKLIVDADPGIGDAVAILVALLDPDLDVVAVNATGGVVSPRVASLNVQAAISACDPEKWPRVGLAPEQLAWEQPAALGPLAQVHGPTGLGDFEFAVPELHRNHEAPKVLIDAVKQDPNGITVVTLGPLSNLAAALERMPDVLALVRGLICQGGSVAVGGNATASAETNFYLDPESAYRVLRSRSTKTLLPLDVTQGVTLSIELFQRWLSEPQTAVGQLLQKLLQFSFRAHHEFLGVESVPLQEVVAIAVASRPELVHAEPRSVEVETEGPLTRGMTVCDRRRFANVQPNLDMALEVNVDGVLEYLAEVLQRA